jgi:hypothetical protein
MWPAAEVATDIASPVKSSAPVLLLSGEADPVTPPWAAEEASKQSLQQPPFDRSQDRPLFQFSCVNKLISEFVSRGSALIWMLPVPRRFAVRICDRRDDAGDGRRFIAREPTSRRRDRRELARPARYRPCQTPLVLRLGKTADGKIGGENG